MDIPTIYGESTPLVTYSSGVTVSVMGVRFLNSKLCPRFFEQEKKSRIGKRRKTSGTYSPKILAPKGLRNFNDII
jgi:hypothetical protein